MAILFEERYLQAENENDPVIVVFDRISGRRRSSLSMKYPAKYRGEIGICLIGEKRKARQKARRVKA